MKTTGTTGRNEGPEHLAFYLARKGTETRDSVRRHAVNAEKPADRAEIGEAQESSGNSDETGEKNGGSAWESNPPATRVTRRPTVLKTAATTRCTSTSACSHGYKVLGPAMQLETPGGGSPFRRAM